ncbi:arginine deiminase [Epidermidibacterium keratini]|uniref:arginine deiminase n=1 Tax=Epidermidibacterium keratini TaxID=1891644 RepID=UPI0018659D6D|nr:arginine deiminase [Epidermidibacterium keratini]
MTAPVLTPYADSEVARLRTVILHRPGPELARLTPRNNDELLFDGVPWVARAQEEHDAFAATLRERDVEVLLLSDLLSETMDIADARGDAIGAVLADPRLGDDLGDMVGSYLESLSPAELTAALIGGVSKLELPQGRGISWSLMDEHDFVVAPLPNTLFTRDSSVWIGPQVAVTSLAMTARRRESSLTAAIYTYHPRFAGAEEFFTPGFEPLEGGDVLLLAPGTIAVGVGERTTPAGAERLARQAFSRGLAETVLVVPIAQDRAQMHLDTVCTMVDRDAMIIYPNIAGSMIAYALTAPDGPDAALQVTGPTPFLRAAADAMGVERIRVIETDLDPISAEREQWDDGNNTLCLAPQVAVAYERNHVTNSALDAAGIDVIEIAGSELGSGRGGPRCMSCPVVRDPL